MTRLLGSAALTFLLAGSFPLGTAALTLPDRPDLKLSMTVDSKTAKADAKMTFRLKLTSRKPFSGTPTVVLTIPKHFSLIFSYNVLCEKPNETTLVCSVPRMADEARANFVFRVAETLPCNLEGDKVTAVITNPIDAAPKDNVAESSFGYQCIPDEPTVSVNLDGPTAADPGEKITYSIKVTNRGSKAAEGVRVLADLAGAFYSGSPRCAAGASRTITDADGTKYNRFTTGCYVDRVEPDSSVTMKVTVRAPSPTFGGLCVRRTLTQATKILATSQWAEKGSAEKLKTKCDGKA